MDVWEGHWESSSDELLDRAREFAAWKACMDIATCSSYAMFPEAFLQSLPSHVAARWNHSCNVELLVAEDTLVMSLVVSERKVTMRRF